MKTEKFRKLISFTERFKGFLLWTGFLLIGLIAAWLNNPASAETSENPLPAELSTFIPLGHTLIPIELKGAEKLDGVLGSHGIVDLYQAPDQPGRRAQLVGRRLRLVRAPLNPQAFAVLVKDSEAERILSYQGPFIASVLSQQSAGHELPPETRKSPSIEFQNVE